MSTATLPTARQSTVYLVDDDRTALDSLQWLLESVHLRVQTFQSGKQLIDSLSGDEVGCIIADVRMPNMSGLELQRKLSSRNVTLPIIFVTGHGDVRSCSRAYREGAFDFMEKPVDDQLLLDRVHEAIKQDRARAAQERPEVQQSGKPEQLTAREHDVMQRLVVGRSLKQIASEFGISVQTAARHRANLLKKMQVQNDVELTRMVLLGGAITPNG